MAASHTRASGSEYAREPRERASIFDAHGHFARPSGTLLRRRQHLCATLEPRASGLTKTIALAALCQRLEVRAQQVLTLGDMPMLESAGCGIAVANAYPDMLAVITTGASNDDDGVARVLEAPARDGWHAAISVDCAARSAPSTRILSKASAPASVACGSQEVR